MDPNLYSSFNMIFVLIIFIVKWKSLYNKHLPYLFISSSKSYCSLENLPKKEDLHNPYPVMTIGYRRLAKPIHCDGFTSLLHYILIYIYVVQIWIFHRINIKCICIRMVSIKLFLYHYTEWRVLSKCCLLVHLLTWE